MAKRLAGSTAVDPLQVGRADDARHKSRATWLRQLRQMDFETPFEVIDLAEAQHNLRRLKRSLPKVEIYYAVKSNSDRRLAQAIRHLVDGFEVASLGEFKNLKSLGVGTKRILFSNPVKVPSHIEATYAAGVQYFAFDSLDEIKKLAKHAPGAKVYARVKVSDTGSKFPLSKKFGIETVQVLDYMVAAAFAGLQPIGLTFHVGSQAEDPQAWARALRRCGHLITKLNQYGIKIEVVNIGGGIPAAYSNKPLAISAITRTINKSIKQFIPADVRIMAELGRSISASSSVIVTSIIAKEIRADGKQWLFLDMGVFQGLMEPLEMPGWRYPIFTDYHHSASQSQNFVLTGPTCDAFDTIGFDYNLPARIAAGDRLYIGLAGAYTTVYGSNFNGFSPPKVYYLESE